MAVKLESISILQKYFTGVVSRANPQLLKINDIRYTLLGVIALDKDDVCSLATEMKAPSI